MSTNHSHARFALTAEELREVPDEDFAGPHRSFPIRNAKDVRDAWDLAGHAEDPEAVRTRIKEIARRKGLERALSGAATMSVAVEFAAPEPDSGDFVLYEGKVFEAGDYPDKAFAIGADELAAKAAEFAGVDLDLEHSDLKDVLGNKLGRLESIWNRGAETIGRLRVPHWLHELAGGKLQTSLSFDQEKNIVGCALTLNPRIEDACVLAAFGRQAHTRETEKEKTKDMPLTLKERLRVLFRKAPEALLEAGIDPQELDKVEFAEPAPKPDPAIQAQLAEFKATNDRLLASQLSVAAALFADEIVRSAKAVPAQREQLIALYKSAALADGHGTVRFTEAGQIENGPNLTALRELFKNAQPHSLFTTQIPNADPNGDDGPDQVMLDKLRRSTPLGKSTSPAFAGATAGKEAK